MEIQKTKIIFILALLIVSFVNAQGIETIDSNPKPECHVNRNACITNGGVFGYDENKNCYCDMTNVPPKPSQLTGIESDYSKLNNEGYLIPFSEPQPSDDEIGCKKLDFCWYDYNNKCYPIGYIKNGTYCSDRDPYYFGKYGIEVPNFVNQSETGKACINNYECKTNICSGNVCVNITEQNTFKNDTEKLNSEIRTNDVNISYYYPLEPIIYEKKNILGKIADFFKNLFR